MTLKHLLIGGLIIAVVVIVLATGGLSACNILESKTGPTPIPTPKPPEALSPIERISELESRYSLLERDNKGLKDKLDSLQLRIIELEAR